ncbi:rhodanese-like domain-containing protein [Endozoicomonas arenosclerae]|uniref:rhodanese-like domain-containing protein n=1 Tax=Endozoicomonas arenosclerae TaxID=1633495 RepID=UPI000786095A|nr:rhodanese-like domain-containing protein [Endozoicomonas arenosclerae]
MKWNSYLAGCFLALASCFLSAQEAPVNIKNVVTINTHQAKRLHELGALFIDVRPYQQWEWGHIDRSHSLDLRAGFRQLFMPGTLDKKTPIVIYGNSTYHMRGAIASYLAALWGYKRVFFFRDGYFSWLALDFPVTLHSDLGAEEEVISWKPEKKKIEDMSDLQTFSAMQLQ